MKEFVFCCMAYMIGSGAHSHHEIYCITDALGIGYQEGRYEHTIRNASRGFQCSRISFCDIRCRESGDLQLPFKINMHQIEAKESPSIHSSSRGTPDTASSMPTLETPRSMMTWTPHFNFASSISFLTIFHPSLKIPIE